MAQTRAADDFATIRARMEELLRECEGAQAAKSDLQRDPPTHRTRAVRWPPSELDAGLGRVRQSGSRPRLVERGSVARGVSSSGIKSTQRIAAGAMTP
jgi:hypothetical protein